MLDIRQALLFATEDPRVNEKAGLGVVISLAPILNLAGLGYQVELARNVIKGEPQPLPAWNDLKHLWVQGARLGLAIYIYSLPLLFTVIGGMALGFVSFILAVQSDSSQSGSSGSFSVLVVLFVLLIGASMLYGLLLGVLQPALVGVYVQRNTFQSCFDFRALWRFIRADPGEYFLIWLIEAVVGLILGLPLTFVIFAVAWIPFVGPLLLPLLVAAVTFYVMLVGGHLVGQLLRARAAVPAT